MQPVVVALDPGALGRGGNQAGDRESANRKVVRAFCLANNRML